MNGGPRWAAWMSLAFTTAASGAAWSAPQGRSVAFVGGTVFPAPDQEPIPDGVLLLVDGRIAAVGSRTEIELGAQVERVACDGASVLAGFWNCHVHFTDPRWAEAGTRAADALARDLADMLTSRGFVHVLDTGSDLANTLALRARLEHGELAGPSVLTAGMPFVPPGGTPFYVAPYRLPELATPEAAAEEVRARLAAGADAIKLFSASPVAPGRVVPMPVPILAAAVAAAHAARKPALAHPTDDAGVRAAVESGVDVLLHTAPDGGSEWDDALVERMRAARVALVPTLQLWEWELTRKDSAPELVDRFLALACQQLGAFAAAGGEVLFGTDVGYMDEFDPSDEYLLLAQAGLDWRAILASLTTAPARRFADERTGRLAPGLAGDVVVLDGRPDRNVSAFARVRASWREGRQLFARP